MRKTAIKQKLAASVAALTLMTQTAYADAQGDLFNLSLEELIEIDIASVSKKSQTLRDVAAAAYVITAEDIRRSGARSLPDALRLAPGVDVARINGGNWAVSIRGFTGRYANKILVLIDGRSVYNAVFSGVFWDTEHVLIEDIERIEVIRGPGAAIWGPNAVNGVINVITRSARDTEGVVAVAEASTAGDWRTGGVIGWKASEDLAFKASVFGQRNAELRILPSDPFAAFSPSDEYTAQQFSLRMDATPSSRDDASIIAQYTRGERSELVFSPVDITQPNVLFEDVGDYDSWSIQGVWAHRFSDDLRLETASAYQSNQREELGSTVEIKSANINVDIHANVGDGHGVSGGVYLQHDRTETTAGGPINLSPADRTTKNWGGFLHSDWALNGDDLRFVLGSTFEDNAFTGFEYQPTARLLWKPTENQSLWAGVSRSVRTPSRIDRDIDFTLGLIPPGTSLNPGPIPVLSVVRGQTTQQSENLWSYEAGYRLSVSDKATFDIAAFYNDYDELQTAVPTMPIIEVVNGAPMLVAPLVATNDGSGRGLGFEISARWSPIRRLRLDAAYAFLDLDVTTGSAGPGAFIIGDGQAPRHQASIQTYFSVTDQLELDLRGAYRSSIVGQIGRIDGYFDLNGRLGWKPIEYLEVSLIAEQINDESRLQIEELFSAIRPTETERRVFGRIRVTY